MSGADSSARRGWCSSAVCGDRWFCCVCCGLIGDCGVVLVVFYFFLLCISFVLCLQLHKQATDAAIAPRVTSLTGGAVADQGQSAFV